MLNWLKKASERAQRKNIAITLSLLVSRAEGADKRIVQTGAISPRDQASVTSLQKSLLTDLIGPVPLDQLRSEYLDPILENETYSDGVKMAVTHVFDTAGRR